MAIPEVSASTSIWSVACSCAPSGNMCASRPPLKPASTRCAPASATSSDRNRLLAPLAVDRIDPPCWSVVVPKTAANHENLWRYQFGQLPEGEMGLRQARAALYLDRCRHAEARDPHHAVPETQQRRPGADR